MNTEQAEQLRAMVLGRSVAALGTLHDGAPYVSMVPFAPLPDGSALVTHVSGLAAHTKDMLADGRVSVLVIEPERDDKPAQALARVTIQAEARRVPDGTDEHEACRRAYLGRFPDAADLFELADFSLFSIAPRSARYVAGFGQAFTLSPEALARALQTR
jgi:heme oxygenase (biliverdin-IX-beta and delta-forming)